MATLNEPIRPGEVILTEQPLTRDAVRLAPDQTVVPGQVVGRITASGPNQGLFGALDLGQTNGLEVPAGVVIRGASTGVAETAPIVIAARLAELVGDLVIYPDGATAAQIALINDALAARFLIVR
jgi:hypothetical protein